MFRFIAAQIVQQAGPHVARHGAHYVVRHTGSLFVRSAHWRHIANGSRGFMKFFF